MRKKLRNYLLRKVFLALVDEDVVPWNRLDVDTKNVLIADSHLILETELWKRVVQSTKWQAQKMLFEKSQTVEDMIFGKAFLYTIDLLDKRLKTISKYK